MGTPHTTAAKNGPSTWSSVLAWACLALAAVLPVATLVGMLQISPAEMLTQMGIHAPSGANPGSLPVAAWQQGLALCIGLLPVGAVAYALWRAHQCFRGFAAGAVFELATVRHLRGFAAGLLVSSMAGLLAPTVMGLVLTLQAPAGGRVLAFSLGSQQLLMLLFAGIVWQIGHVMTRAVELAEDNAQII